MKRFLPLLALAVVAAGCSSSQDDGMSASDTKLANDVNTWVKSTNGDWDKLSAEQKQQMIQSAGSEATARKVFEMKAHPPQPAVPGPPPTRPGGQ